MAPKKKPDPIDYVTDDVRSDQSALRVYVSKGEKKLIDEAVRKSMRIPNRSDFMATIAIKHACEILGIPYPLTKK